MKVRCRDLGPMDYAACWELQRTLFEELLAEKNRRRNGCGAAPVFVTYGVSNHGDAKLVGMECEHLRMDLMQRQKPNTKIQSIAFQQPTHYQWVRAGKPIDVCYQIVENHYRGCVTTQLRIKDIKPVEK